MEQKTPLALITGSLGSGKTTLLQRILDTTERRLAVLMNEFGEIAIDSRIIQGENLQIIELAGGCVCCSLTGELEAAVAEIITKAHPELILVEATGVAEADALVYEVEDNLPRVRLDSVICIVDAYTSIKFPQVGYVSRTQLQAADIIIINKIDLVAPEDIERIQAQLRMHNARALVIQVAHCNVDVNLLFGLDVAKHKIPRTPHDQTKFQSFVFVSTGVLDADKFRALAADLPPSVYRAKGFVRLTEGSSLFNYVMGHYDLEEFAADQTQLVFIGQDLALVQTAIVDQLRHCEV